MAARVVFADNSHPKGAEPRKGRWLRQRGRGVLQGDAIPRMFGEAASYNHMLAKYQINKRPIPALLLENLEGSSLYSLSAEELGSSDPLPALQDVYTALTQHGVVHGDPKLHNFFRVGDRVVAINLEMANPLPCDITNEDELRTMESEIERRLQPEGWADWISCHVWCSAWVAWVLS